MALKLPKKKKPNEGDDQKDGEEVDPEDAVVDAPAGYAPRVVKTPMHDGADVNPEIAQKQERAMASKQKPDVKKGAGWNAKDERQYKHIKESGASEKIAAATVNKQRRKEGRLLHKSKPNVELLAKGPLEGNNDNTDGVNAARAYTGDAYHAIKYGASMQANPQPKVSMDASRGYDSDKPQPTRQPVAAMQKPQPIATSASPPKPQGPTMLAQKSVPNVQLLAKGGAGSRGGVISYYTKKGAPVYQSKVKKMAPQFSQMARNWSSNAHRSHKADDHATAAKQHLAAAFYSHHAGQHDDAVEHLHHAEYHHGEAKDHGPDKSYADKPSGRTMKWIEKNKQATHDLVHGDHGAHSSEHNEMVEHLKKHGYSDPHGVAKKLRGEGMGPHELHSRLQVPEGQMGSLQYTHGIKKSVDYGAYPPSGSAGGPGSRGGHVIGHTKSGKPVYGVKKVHARLEQKASEAVAAHGLFSDKAHPAVSHSQRALDQHFSEVTPGYEMHWSPQDHHEAGNMIQDHKRDNVKDRHEQYALQGLANRHFDAARKKEDAAKYAAIDRHEGHPHGTTARRAAEMKKSLLAMELHEMYEDHVSKALTPGNNIGGNMKNEVEDLFKSELGSDKPITKCVHCTHDLTKSDLRKGLGTHFVADDNDNPHDGKEGGQVELSRPGAGVSENDVIAPLLKGLKGPDAGDAEEFPIHKSEMDEMDLNTEGMEDGWYTISKSEMKRLGAEQHIAYLADRKQRVAKSSSPNVIVKSASGARPGYTPRAGGVHGANGESLVEWVEGSDKQIAEYIEKSGGFGQGTDELARNGQRHG